MTMPIGRAVSICIDTALLKRVDTLQPSHLTRKAFVNQLVLEAIELREEKAAHSRRPLPQ
jgi:hypothetical protein